MVRNILYALGPKQTLTPGASISWAFDGRPAVVDLSENGTLTVTGPIADFPMVGLLKVTHVVAGTELTLTGDSSNVAWSTGAGQHTILEFVWDGTEYVWTSRTKTATAALTQLSTPASFAATAASDTQIDLSWTDGANESSYLIEVSDTGTGGWSTLATPAAGSTSYSHTGLTAETAKYYRIKAVGDGTTYSDSAYATANATTEAESTAGVDLYATFAGANGTTLNAYTPEIGTLNGGDKANCLLDGAGNVVLSSGGWISCSLPDTNKDKKVTVVYGNVGGVRDITLRSSGPGVVCRVEGSPAVLKIVTWDGSSLSTLATSASFDFTQTDKTFVATAIGTTITFTVGGTDGKSITAETSVSGTGNLAYGVDPQGTIGVMVDSIKVENA